MAYFEEQVKQRKEYLRKLMENLERELRKMPAGKMRVSKNKGIPRYYWIKEPKDTHGKYISRKEETVMYQLAQKDYMEKMYKSVKAEYDAVKEYLEKYGDKKLIQVYNELNSFRKKLVAPAITSDEVFVKQWEEEEYEINPYHPEEKVYSTKKDELVRSKSEVMIADMYYELGIPYRYEAQISMYDGKKKYPDFTLLDISKRKIIYHEHLGLMDDDQYRKLNLIKIDEYRRNGIFFGKNLIVTFEAEGSYLNMRELKCMVRELFGKQ